MVTIIVPAYNCIKYLKDTVQSALSQSYPDLELLILDDGSTDGTLDLIDQIAGKDSRIRALPNERNLGVAQTRNRGLAAAQGEYVAFLDADDLWMPDKLERQIGAIREKELDLCYTAYSFIDSTGSAIRKPYHVPETLSLNRLLSENVIGLSSAIVRTDAIGTVRMREEYAHEDYVFWLELFQKGCRAGGVDIPLMQYRVSESNRSGDKKKAALGRWEIYRKFLGMGLPQSLWWFLQYGIKGLRKVSGR